MALHPLDTYNFREMILGTPDQFEVGFELAKDIRVPGMFQSIMISGMGGSALPGDLLRIYLQGVHTVTDRQIAIYENRSYGLPEEGREGCLHVVSSYSGNTEETISAFEEVLRLGLPCIGMSSGGRIEALCKKKGIPHIKLPIPMPGFQPRMGTGYFFGALLQVLINHDLVPDTKKDVLRDIPALRDLFPALEKEGQQIAITLEGKTPVIYAPSGYGAVAMVWKIKLNENAKIPAFWNVFPELNHNEMVGFTKPQADFTVMMLRDESIHPQMLKRFEVTKKLLLKQGIGVQIIDMVGETTFMKMFSSIALADFVSYYLALSYEQDPTPVQMVEDLKKML